MAGHRGSGRGSSCLTRRLRGLGVVGVIITKDDLRRVAFTTTYRRLGSGRLHVIRLTEIALLLLLLLRSLFARLML